MKAWLAVTLLLGGDLFADGLRAFEQGRFGDALAAFRAAEAAAGDDAPAELLYDEALAALRAGELGLADAALRKAAARGAPEVAALCDFLRGNVEFARSELAETRSPDPSLLALDQAIVDAERAREAWQRAAVSRADWPQARRNVERALLRLDDLQRKRAEATQRSEPLPAPRPRLQPPAEPPRPEDAPQEQPAPIEPQLRELTADELKRLIERLDEQEEAKLALRRARRRAPRSDVEKDW